LVAAGEDGIREHQKLPSHLENQLSTIYDGDVHKIINFTREVVVPRCFPGKRSQSGRSGLRPRNESRSWGKDMDTDDLSEEAYEVLTIAHGINEFLWVEMGSLSSNYKDEESYLKGWLKFIKEIRKDPEEFQDRWLLEEPINPKHLLLLEEQIKKVQNIPYRQRHIPEY
jgi:hypothetical protein